MKQNLF